MAGEFKALLAEFVRFAENYCENAKQIVPGPDYVKLVEVYQRGLSTACQGLAHSLEEQYDAASKQWRQQADDFIALTGTLPMVKAANKVIGRSSFHDSGALSASAGVAEKVKKAISMIPGLLPFPIPFVGGVGKLLDLIDNFIDLIRELFGSPNLPGKPTVEKPPDVPSKTIEPCIWVPLHEGGEAELMIFSADLSGEVEVRVDGKISPKKLEPFYQSYKAKKTIEVHLLRGGASSANVGYEPVK
jgi:hypothetical protein